MNVFIEAIDHFKSQICVKKIVDDILIKIIQICSHDLSLQP